MAIVFDTSQSASPQESPLALGSGSKIVFDPAPAGSFSGSSSQSLGNPLSAISSFIKQLAPVQTARGLVQGLDAPIAAQLGQVKANQAASTESSLVAQRATDLKKGDIAGADKIKAQLEGMVNSNPTMQTFNNLVGQGQSVMTPQQIMGAGAGTAGDAAALFGGEALGGGSLARIGAQGLTGVLTSGGQAEQSGQSPTQIAQSAGEGGALSAGTAGVLEGIGGLVNAGGNLLSSQGQKIADNSLPEGLNITKAQQNSFFKQTGEQLLPFMKDNGLMTADPNAIQSAISDAQQQFNSIAKDSGSTVPLSDLATKLQDQYQTLADKTDPAYQAQAQKFAQSANALLDKYSDTSEVPVAALNSERIAQDALVKGNWNDPASQGVHRTMRDILSSSVEDATKNVGDLDAVGNKLSQLFKFNDLIGSKLGSGAPVASGKSLAPYLARAIIGGVGGAITGKSPTSAAVGGGLGLAEGALESQLTPSLMGSGAASLGNNISSASSPQMRALLQLLTTAGSTRAIQK